VTTVTTPNSPWVELGLGPAPLGTDVEVRRAIDDMAGLGFFCGTPPCVVVYVRTRLGSVDDPNLDFLDPSLIPGFLQQDHPGAGGIPPIRIAADTPVILVKAECVNGPPELRGESLTMLDATNSNILAQPFILAVGRTGGLDDWDWGRYGKVTTLECGAESCRCVYAGCDG